MVLPAKAKRQHPWDSEEETAVAKDFPYALPWWHCVLTLM